MRLFNVCAVAAFAALSMASSSFANELDGPISAEQNAHAAELPATLVVRVNNVDQSVAVLQSNQALATDNATAEAVRTSNFTPMSVNGGQPSGELDRDSSTNSWYFYFYNYNWYRPTYYYYGYNYYYQPYYWYNYGNYSYYWYGWRRW